MSAGQSVEQRARGGLVGRVIEELRGDIASGRFDIGAKLPSQAELSARFSVSRPVIREAVASLQADGVLESHQGAGVFVRARAAVVPFAFKAIDQARISSMLETLELRSAVEIEAAGLAALRRSPLQEEEIFRAHNALVQQVEQGVRSADADFAFHRAIAEATNNPRFPEFLDLLGKSAIPRRAVQAESGTDAPVAPDYLHAIVAEHWGIADAISAGDNSAARAAMRRHLSGSQQRYRALLRGAMS